MKIKYLVISLVVVMLVALAAFGLVPMAASAVSAAALPANHPSAAVASDAGVSASAADMQAAFESIYAQVNPSVVSIDVVEQAQQSNFGPSGQFGAPFGRGQPANPQSQAQRALGSGFVWNSDGYIVTNNHVISGASRITVIFADGTMVPGQVVGADPNSDLAVVKVNAPANELHPVQVADSTQTKVGQLAIAIGNPFGEQNTMTTGIVSALGRTLPVNENATQGPSYTIPDVIQTDAPINPGNSGGVLLNLQGQVVGVTSAIESPVSASSGIGFAIPAQIVQNVVPALIKNGHYDHSYLGVSGTTMTPSIAQAMGLSQNQRGALVVDVTSGGPAAGAGLQGSSTPATIDGQSATVGGDIITAIDGHSVQTFDDVVAYLASSTSVNQTVTLTILRDGKQMNVPVTLAARPTTQSNG